MRIKSLPQLIVGGAIVLVGVGFLLDAFNAWDFSSFMSEWWPVLVMLVGFASLLTNPTMPLWPLFIIGAGALLLVGTLDIADFEVWQVIWPAALIVFGLSFFFRQLMPRPKAVQDNKSDLFVAFSGIESANKSDKYQGGSLSAVFGGIKLDLSQATIKDRAKLDVFTAFGGVELIVPENWVVHTSGLPLFGGWEDKTRKPSVNKAPVLEVHGTCIFGGVEIKN